MPVEEMDLDAYRKLVDADGMTAEGAVAAESRNLLVYAQLDGVAYEACSMLSAGKSRAVVNMWITDRIRLLEVRPDPSAKYVFRKMAKITQTDFRSRERALPKVLVVADVRKKKLSPVASSCLMIVLVIALVVVFVLLKGA